MSDKQTSREGGQLRSSEARTATVTRERYDWDDVQPSTAVIETVARAVDEDPVELESLSSVLDADALDTLFTGARPGQQHEIEMEFYYEGLLVTIRSSGLVEIASASGEP